jgi:glutamyl-tRNA synthetase
VDDLSARLEQFTHRSGLRGAAAISQEKIQTLADFWPLTGFVFDGPAKDEQAFQKTICAEGGAELLAAARRSLASAPEPFDATSVQKALDAVVQQHGVKPGKVFQPVRVSLAGTTISPGIYETVALLGRDQSLSRIDHALERARTVCG